MLNTGLILIGNRKDVKSQETMLVTIMYLVVMGKAVVDGRRVVDLTHTLDNNAPKMELKDFGVTNMTYYKRNIVLEKYTDTDTWLALGTVEFYEHMGTHIDAPFHFGNGRQKLHEIPASRLVGPGVVIDVKDKAKDNINYAVTVEDILDYEKEFGRIPAGAIVMMNSGWDRRYPDPVQVFGTTDIDNFASYQFPGFGIAACKMLHHQRQVGVLGVDTAAVDPIQVGKLDCHRYLQPLNVPLLEYVANLDNIPQNGTTIVLGVPKIRDATGSPTRILAFVDEDGDGIGSAGNVIGGSLSSSIMVCLAVCSMLID